MPPDCLPHQVTDEEKLGLQEATTRAAVEEARARGAAAKPGLDALFEQLDRGNVDALLLGLVKRRNPAWAPPKRV